MSTSDRLAGVPACGKGINVRKRVFGIARSARVGTGPEPSRHLNRRTTSPDFLLLFAGVALVMIGLVMVASASLPLSYEMFKRPAHLFSKQVVAAVLGLALLALLMRGDYHRLDAVDGSLLLVALGLMSLTLVPSLAPGGLWLEVGPLSFQPAELGKLALVVYLGASLVRKQARGELTRFGSGVMPFFALLGVFSLLALAQPDYAMVVIYGAIVAFMLLIAGVRLIHLWVPAVCGLSLFFGLILLSPTHRERLTTFLNPLADPQGAGYHLMQSFIALGSGGIIGRGLGASREKWLFLPSAYNDFILSVIGEELGLIGVTLVIGLFAMLAWRGFRVAARAPDRFGFLLGAGITFTLCAQAVINFAVAVGTLPVTGLTLPLVSYGGSSLIVSLAMIGVLLSISRHTGERRASARERAPYGITSDRKGGPLERQHLGRRRGNRRSSLPRARHHRGAPTPLSGRNPHRIRRHVPWVGSARDVRPSWSGVL